MDESLAKRKQSSRILHEHFPFLSYDYFLFLAVFFSVPKFNVTPLTMVFGSTKSSFSWIPLGPTFTPTFWHCLYQRNANNSTQFQRKSNPEEIVKMFLKFIFGLFSMYSIKQNKVGSVFCDQATDIAQSLLHDW